MKTVLVIAVVGLAMAALHASATLLVDVDNAFNTLSGVTVTFEANENGGGIPNTGTKFSSVTLSGTDRTATIADPETRFDYYLQWNNLDIAGLAASTYQYAEIYYSLSDDWNGDIAKFRLGDTITVPGTSGANDHFSNPELLNDNGRTAGSHSFIVDLTSDVTYAGDWNYLRWNFFNSTEAVGDAGKSLTIDKLVLGTAITAIPEPSSLVLLSLGALALVIRRFTTSSRNLAY